MIWDKMFLFERIAAATATAHPIIPPAQRARTIPQDRR